MLLAVGVDVLSSAVCSCLRSVLFCVRSVVHWRRGCGSVWSCWWLLAELPGLLRCTGVGVLCVSVCVLWWVCGAGAVGVGVLVVAGEVVLSSVVCWCLCSVLFCVCSVGRLLAMLSSRLWCASVVLLLLLMWSWLLLLFNVFCLLWCAGGVLL